MMKHNSKNVYSSLDSLIATANKSVKDATVKIATKQRPALMSFDETETMAVPSKGSTRIVLSGPAVEEQLNNGDLRDVLEQEAADIVHETMFDISNDLRRVLK